MTQDRIVLRYISDTGGYLASVPARDLTQTDVDELDLDVEALAATPLYVLPGSEEEQAYDEAHADDELVEPESETERVARIMETDSSKVLTGFRERAPEDVDGTPATEPETVTPPAEPVKNPEAAALAEAVNVERPPDADVANSSAEKGGK